MVGLGGIFVEVLNDKAIRLLSVDEDDASAMLRELKGFRILEGTRGQKKRDIPALISAMVGLSKFFLGCRALLSDLEVNPLIVREEGKGVAAVDVRMIRRN
jgi:acyl-CoA synthetase (NDP forming)